MSIGDNENEGTTVNVQAFSYTRNEKQQGQKRQTLTRKGERIIYYFFWIILVNLLIEFAARMI